MSVFRKGRRKDKDAPLVAQDDNKLPLEEEISCDKVLIADWEKLVRLPPDIDQNEWLATHTLSFFDHINMIYGSVSEFCTSTGCPSMNGPANTQYQWVDEKGKKCKCAAPQYVEYVMTYAKKTIHDENVFPTKYGNVFPANYDTQVKKIHRLLFHVIAHLYAAHHKEMTFLRLHPHLNTLLEHFYTFSRQFNLVEEKETEVLSDLYEKLRGASVSSIQKDLMGEGSSEPLPPPSRRSGSCCEDLSVCTATGQSDDCSDSIRGDRLTGSETSAIRPTALPCGREYGHTTHHSANGNASCHPSLHDDHNKENVLCDSNQSQTALSSPMTTPMST